MNIYQKLADAVVWIHGMWVLVVVLGTLLQFVLDVYQPVHFVIVMTTLATKLIGRGKCPLVDLENSMRERYGQSQVYNGSFTRHYTKKYTGVDIPQGAVDALFGVIVALALVAWFW